MVNPIGDNRPLLPVLISMEC